MSYLIMKVFPNGESVSCWSCGYNDGWSCTNEKICSSDHHNNWISKEDFKLVKKVQRCLNLK